MYAAYDEQPESLRANLGSLMAFHDLGPEFEFVGRCAMGDEAAGEVAVGFRGEEHPSVTTHPKTKVQALFAAPEVAATHRSIEGAVNAVSFHRRGYSGSR